MVAKTKALKRKRAFSRKIVRNQLSPKDQLTLLDTKFGIGKGAKLERARLHNIIKNRDKEIGA